MPFTLTSPSPSSPSTVSTSSDAGNSTPDIFFDTHFSSLFDDQTNQTSTSTDILMKREQMEDCCEETVQKSPLKRKRVRGKDKTSNDEKSCILSEFIDPLTVSPPIMHEEKKKRRKRARTEEEKRQRALERKMKNRQSAMRSRQRVLNELKKDKEEIKKLQEENERQRDHIADLERELLEARRQIKVLSSSPAPISQQSSTEPMQTFDEQSVLDIFEAVTGSTNVNSLNHLSSMDLQSNAFQRINSFNLDFDGNSSFDALMLSLKAKGGDSKHCFVGLDQDEFPSQSCYDSESHYNETASFGRTRKMNRKVSSRSLACAYRFSWLSEIWRLKKQLTETMNLHDKASKISKNDSDSAHTKEGKRDNGKSFNLRSQQVSASLADICKMVLRNSTI